MIKLVNVIIIFFIDVEDYNGGLRTINVSAGVMTQPFTILIVNDIIVECNETFNVTIVSVTTCGVAIGSNDRTVVRIVDDDGRQIVIVCVCVSGLCIHMCVLY